MAKKIKELEKYTEAAKAIATFQEKNAGVFTKYNALLLAQSEAEDQLKTAVRESIKDNIANDDIKVTYSPVFKKFYDAETVVSMVKPKQRETLAKAGAITMAIDTSKFEDLVEKGEIDVKIKQKAFREVEQTPRVIIKEL